MTRRYGTRWLGVSEPVNRTVAGQNGVINGTRVHAPSGTSRHVTGGLSDLHPRPCTRVQVDAIQGFGGVPLTALIDIQTEMIEELHPGKGRAFCAALSEEGRFMGCWVSAAPVILRHADHALSSTVRRSMYRAAIRRAALFGSVAVCQA